MPAFGWAPVITCNLLKAREKLRVQDAIGFGFIGFGFVSHWLND